MNTVLVFLVWVAEGVQRLASLGWWFVPILLPGGVVGVWLWLRPTGKHRRPRPGRPERTASAVAAVEDGTPVSHRVATAGGEADG